MGNLDYLCMQTAQRMVRVEASAGDKENVATKALGVLLENGPYGCMLFLQTHSKQTIGHCYRDHLLSLCRETLLASYLSVAPPQNPKFDGIAQWLQQLAENLDRYLFVKRLWQQTLTYARYHAKVEEDV